MEQAWLRRIEGSILIWFDPVANGGTPMCQGFSLARNTLQAWLNQHPSCFPPIVINITDGEATDGDPSDSANLIKTLKSNDGEVLLFNLHISSQRATPIEFADSEDGLPDRFAQLLFRMSSILPVVHAGEWRKKRVTAFLKQVGDSSSMPTWRRLSSSSTSERAQ